MLIVAKVWVVAVAISWMLLAITTRLVAVSDSVMLVAIPAVTGVIVVGMQLWASSRTAKALREADKLSKANYTLLNHEKGVMLDNFAEQSRRIQELDPSPENLEKALRDERAALAHHAAQMIVDAQSKTGPAGPQKDGADANLKAAIDRGDKAVAELSKFRESASRRAAPAAPAPPAPAPPAAIAATPTATPTANTNNSATVAVMNAAAHATVEAVKKFADAPGTPGDPPKT